MKTRLTIRNKQAAVRKWLAEGLTQSQALKALDIFESSIRRQARNEAEEQGER